MPHRYFISPPKNIFKAFALAWRLVFTGYTAYREDHQITLTKRE